MDKKIIDSVYDLSNYNKNAKLLDDQVGDILDQFEQAKQKKDAEIERQNKIENENKKQQQLVQKELKAQKEKNDLYARYGISEDNIYSGKELTDLYYLDNYTEILSSRTSSSREALSKAFYQMDTDTAAFRDQFSTEEKSAITLAAANQGREENFMICFGAPFSYLEAVDPYGRVYKDTFGLRREETWPATREGLLNSNTDSKVFLAYIKVGMVSQVEGKGITDILSNASDQVTGNSNEIDIRTKAISSFALTYFVNKNVLVTKNEKWQDGQIVPFNKFILNALNRIILTHTSPSVSGVNWDNRLLDQKNSTDFKERRKNLFNKINRIFGDNSYPFFKFVCSEETIINETIQNQLGESFIKGLVDKGSDLSREISFVTGGGDAVEYLKKASKKISERLNSGGEQGKEQGLTSKLLSGALDTFSSFLSESRGVANNVFGEDLVNIILKGNSLIYPRVWKGSSIEKMLSLQMRFYSPYGDWFSIFINVVMPLIVIMGFSLPRQVYPSFVSFPFSFSIQIPGLFQSEMAMVTNLAVRRGGRYDAWTDYSVMRGIDITLDITPLKPMYGLPEEIPDSKNPVDGYSGVFAPSDDIYGGRNDDVRGDMTFANMLRNMSGSFIMSDQNLDSNTIKTLEQAFGEYNDAMQESNTSTTDKERDVVSDLNQKLSDKNEDTRKKIAEKQENQKKNKVDATSQTKETSGTANSNKPEAVAQNT